MPDTSGLVKKLNYDKKITKIESKIPRITWPSYCCCIPKVSDLVKKTYNVITSDIE